MKIRFILTTAAILVAVMYTISGCGGGGSSSNIGSTPPPGSGTNDNNFIFNIGDGKNDAFEVREGEPFSFTLSFKDSGLDAGTIGQLVVVDLSDTLKYYDIEQHAFVDSPTVYPISTLDNLTVSLGSNLPVGTYTYSFGVDLVENGSINENAKNLDSLTGYVVNTFAAPIDPEKVITAAYEDGIEVRFPVNEVVIFTEEGVSKNTIEGVIGSAGGTLVGQVSDYGLYQAKFQTTTKEALDKVIDQLSANPSILHASYNIIAKRTSSLSYPPKADINLLQDDGRSCAFSDIDYIPALAIFEGLKSDISLSPVSVAVVEEGVDRSHPELSHIKTLVNLENMGDPLRKDDHGTIVMGVIAAADNGTGVNGLASRFLGDKLQVSSGGDDNGIGYYHFIVLAERAKTHLKASIVNLSGFYTLKASTAILANSILTRKLNNVLFVVSADNEPHDYGSALLRDFPDWPAASSLSNVITVGGTAVCKPTSRWGKSAYGEGVDIAAPAEWVPVITTALSPKGVADGNSVSAPMVTSLAAIIKSIYPSADPLMIRNIMNGHIMPDSAKLGEVRLSFPDAIIEAITLQKPNLMEKFIIRNQADGTPYAIGLIDVLYGGECSYSIEEVGSENWNGYDFVGGLGGVIFQIQNLTGVQWFGDYEKDDHLSGFMKMDFNFHLETTLNDFMRFKGPMTDCIDDTASIKFSKCKIIMRPQWEPSLPPFVPIKDYFIQTEGEFAGSFHCYLPDGKESQNAGQGTFKRIIGVEVDNYSQYLEENCEGGIKAYYLLNK